MNVIALPRPSILDGLILLADRLVDTGLAFITSQLSKVAAQPTNYYVGFGTSSASDLDTATALGTEVDSRAAATLSQQTGTVTNDTARYVATVTAGATRAIVEAGLFDASTAGNMIVRSVFTVINLGSGDGITFTIDIVFA